MAFSLLVSTGTVTIHASGHTEAERVIRVMEDGRELGTFMDKRVIRPEDDISTDTTRAAKLADAARKLESDEVSVPVTVRTRG